MTISVRDRPGASRGARVPVEMQDAVELWARSKGRHARIAYIPAMRTYVVEIELKADDPRMRGWQEGRLPVKPTEQVFLHYQPKPGSSFKPLALEDIGVSGLMEILNKGDMTSGRGEYSSPQEVVNAIGRRNEALEESIKKAARDNARQRGRDLYRHTHVPKTTVPTNIGD